jgi:hypothetical protein
MATHTSTVPDVLDALKALLDARRVAAPAGALAGVEVRTAPSGDPVPFESIQMFGTAGDQEWAALGNRRRRESYTIRAGIFIRRMGAGEALAKEVRDRAYAILAELEDAIRVSPTLGLPDRVTIQLARVDLEQGLNPDDGRIAALDLDLAVTAELVSS